MALPHSFDPEALGTLIFPNVLSVILVFGILAFFGYRLLRYFLVIGGAVGCGLIGYTVVSPLMTGVLDLASPSQFLLSALLAIAFALAGGLLVNRFMRVSVYLFTACIGYYLFHLLALFLAQRLSALSFLGDPAPAAIFATVLGLALGSLILPRFKAVYISITSVGGLALAGYLVATLLLDDASVLTYVFALIGIIGGVFAMRYQFRTNLKSRTPGDTDDETDEPSETTPPPEKESPRKKEAKAKAAAPSGEKRRTTAGRRLRPRSDRVKKQRRQGNAEW